MIERKLKSASTLYSTAIFSAFVHKLAVLPTIANGITTNSPPGCLEQLHCFANINLVELANPDFIRTNCLFPAPCGQLLVVFRFYDILRDGSRVYTKVQTVLVLHSFAV